MLSSRSSPWARYRTPPPPPTPPPPGIFWDNDFWIAQYVSFQYLLVCKMNYSAFRDYLRWYIAVQWHVLKWACPLQIPNNRQLYSFFGHTEILHVLVSMGSTALAAAVVLPRYGGLNYACGINEDWKRKYFTLHNFGQRSCKNIEQKCFIYHQMYHGDWLSHRECLINTCINGWRQGIVYTQVQKLSNLLPQ